METFMLYRDPPQVRHRCRNPRCGATLKNPTPSPHDAFYCSGCESGFCAAIGRLASAGIPETEIRQAIALMRTGRVDLLARVIAGDLDVARALRLARSR
jgi:hypothetical protein